MISHLLSRGFRRNQRVIHAHADGLTHAESLTQTEFNVNCFNWVLGHIVKSRSDILELLDAPRVTTPEQEERYLRESDPITSDGAGVLAFEELLRLLDATEGALEEALERADEEFMRVELPTDGERTAPRAAQVMFSYFHDTYHTGQTEILRQLSGRDDKII
jgi:uncharacterized damage-inducible protein DinB